MTKLNDCKTEKSKLTAAEWRAQWDEDCARVFSVAKGFPGFREIQSLIGRLVAKGASYHEARVALNRAIDKFQGGPQA